MFATETLVLDAQEKSAFKLGLRDFLSCLKMWKLFIYLGIEDIRQRYIRTFLGPMWLIVGTGIWVGVMGFVMASLFGKGVQQTLPFVAAGIILWTFISNVLTDGCMLFVNIQTIIHSVSLPISLHVSRFLTRHFIIFLHNFIILAIVFLLCHVPINMNTLLVIPGLMLLILNAFWMGAFLGITNARFRDIQQLISTSMTILPFVTPIFWEKGFLQKHAWIANINPVYHAVEVVRAPLLGQQPAMLSYIVMLALTAIGLVIAMNMFGKFKHQVIYWL